MNTNVIEVKNLTVSYNKKTAIRNINLEIKAGSVIGILGPNGAGKSTLLKAIVGLMPADTGEIKIFGGEISSERKKISYIPQKEQYDWDFPVNVYDVVMMGRYVHLPLFRFPKLKDKSIVQEMVKKLGMEKYANRQIRQLSGGQQQRIFLARALAQQSEVYLLDEPFAGVDAKTEKIIIDLLKELKSQGKTLLVVHHDLGNVTEYFDELILINHTLIAFGKVGSVFTKELITKTYGGRLSILQQAESLTS